MKFDVYYGHLSSFRFIIPKKMLVPLKSIKQVGVASLKKKFGERNCADGLN